MENIYQENGFKNRKEYLDTLAEDYGEAVYMVADLLGPSEDFDGLPVMLEDHCE